MGKLKAVMILAALAAAAPAHAQEQKGKAVMTLKGQMMLYQMSQYNGAEYMVRGTRSSVILDWNIGSIGIHPGDRWEVCAQPRFKQPCQVLDASVADAAGIGITTVGSARKAPAAAK